MADRQLYEITAARQRVGGKRVYRLPIFWVWCETAEQAKMEATRIIGYEPGYRIILKVREA